MKDLLFYAVPAMGIVGLLYTLLKFNWVSKQDAGNDRMKEISTYIAEGAMAFLKAEWKILGYFVVIVALLLGFMATKNAESHWSIAISFVIGAVFSATAGYIGMKVATKVQSVIFPGELDDGFDYHAAAFTAKIDCQSLTLDSAHQMTAER